MNCGLYRKGLIELARGYTADRTVAAHLESCEGCRDFLAGQRRLTVAVRGVASSAASTALPKGLESELLAEFDAVHRVVRRPRAFWLTAGGFALAAAALVTVVLLRSPAAEQKPQALAKVHKPPVEVQKPTVKEPVLTASRPITMPPRPLRNKRPPSVPQAAETQETAFVAIPYTMPLAANERADVVRMDVPVAALIAAGLPLRVQDMSANASADVLVGEDGRARAVRLISVADTGSNRRFR